MITQCPRGASPAGRGRRLYRAQADVLAALAQPVRLAIVDLLRDGPRCVCDITAAVAAERSNVSRHLAVLHKAGLLEQRKEGLRVMYSLKTPCIVDFLSCIDGVLRARAQEARALLRRL